MFYKHDTRMITILGNVYEHLKRDWDYLLVIVGDTGTGKSIFSLQMLETWYNVILKQVVSKDMSRQIASDYGVWVKNFKYLKAFDMNIYDEGARTLESRQHMTKLSKDLTKLFNVFRSKKFFTIIVIPNFFYLNKYFRENRLRGLVWLDKRGHYRFYSKKGITYLNAYNERRIVKSMHVAYPIHRSTFPDYKGVLLKAYLSEKNKSIEAVLDEVILGSVPNVTMVDHYSDEVLVLKGEGLTVRGIAERLDISVGTVHSILIKADT